MKEWFENPYLPLFAPKKDQKGPSGAFAEIGCCTFVLQSEIPAGVQCEQLIINIKKIKIMAVEYVLQQQKYGADLTEMLSNLAY